MRPNLDKTLAAYLEGELVASEARAVEAQLAESLDARSRLEQLLHLRDALAAPMPPLDELDLTASVRAAIAEAPSKRSYARMVSIVAGIGLAACFALFTLQPRDESSEFRAKSAGVGLAAATVPAFRAYVVESGKPPAPVVGSIESDAALLFSYTNPGPHPYSYLMIFGVDGSGQVRWFYPAYEKAGEDPMSISIAPCREPSVLPDQIRHDLAAGRIVLYALFSREPLHVSELERTVHSAKSELTAPPREQAVLLRISARVGP